MIFSMNKNSLKIIIQLQIRLEIVLSSQLVLYNCISQIKYQAIECVNVQLWFHPHTQEITKEKVICKKTIVSKKKKKNIG